MWLEKPVQRKCETCGKTFQTFLSNASECYGCALKRFCGGGMPEEGDFNSASLVSGNLSPEDRRQLQRDLAAVERSSSCRESFDDDVEYFDIEEYESDYDDE